MAVDLSWQEIRPVPTPKPAPAGLPKPQGQASLPGGASAAPAETSPNSLPSNLMTVVSPTTMGTSPQVAPQPK